MPAAMPIASEMIEYGAAIGSTVPELMKFVMRPAMPPTHGPARRPPSTVPIESRKSGSFKVLAIACPAQSMAMQTGMSTIASVFILTLNALRMPKVNLPKKPDRQKRHIRRRVGAACQSPRRGANMCGVGSVTVAPGANSTVGEDEVARLVAGLARDDVVVLQLEIPLPAVLAAIQSARDVGARVVLNAAPTAALTGRAVPEVEVLIVNEGEA